MSMTPRISVIVVFLDAARFLRDALQSVVEQDFRDWELVLVDDGSRDGSAAIAHEFRAQYPDRVRCLEHAAHARLGISASRNLGLAAARGEYIAFLDADDQYLPGRLDRHVRVLDGQPAVDLVQSLDVTALLSGSGRVLHQDHVRPCPWADGAVLDPPELLVAKLASPAFMTGICSITFRRDVAIALGGSEPEFRTLYEDQALLTKFYGSRRVYVLSAPLAKIRVFPGVGTRTCQRTAFLPWGRWQRATRAFRCWQLDRIRERNDVAALISAGLLRVETGPSAIAVEGILITLRSMIGTLLRWVLPTAAFGGIVLGRRQRAARGAEDRFRKVCSDACLRGLAWPRAACGSSLRGAA